MTKQQKLQLIEKLQQATKDSTINGYISNTDFMDMISIVLYGVCVQYGSRKRTLYITKEQLENVQAIAKNMASKQAVTLSKNNTCVKVSDSVLNYSK